jgi:hypothetical protein
MSKYTAKMAHEAAARGAAWLDEQCPNWANEINLDRLNLASATFCVLGQTAKCLLGQPNPRKSAMRGGYDEVRYRHPAADTGKWALKNGFAPDTWEDWGTAAEMLTIAWRELIRERLEARP